MLDKYVREGPMIRGPQFLARLRSHTVFENTPVRLFCTVDGFPMPVVKWWELITCSFSFQHGRLAYRLSFFSSFSYDSNMIVDHIMEVSHVLMLVRSIFLCFRYKDDVILDVSSGKYLVVATGGAHSLEIPRYRKHRLFDYCKSKFASYF